MTVAALCKELKIEPYDARVKLRGIDAKEYPELAKAHKPKKAWKFAKGSGALKEARLVKPPQLAASSFLSLSPGDPGSDQVMASKSTNL